MILGNSFLGRMLPASLRGYFTVSSHEDESAIRVPGGSELPRQDAVCPSHIIDMVGSKKLVEVKTVTNQDAANRAPLPYVSTGTKYPQEFYERQVTIWGSNPLVTRINTAGMIYASNEPKNGIPSVQGEREWADAALFEKNRAIKPDAEFLSGSAAARALHQKQVSARANEQIAPVPESVAAALDRTDSVLGRTFMRLRLARPTDDRALTASRRELNRVYVGQGNPGAANGQIQGAILQAGKHEADMLSIWDNKIQFPGRYLDRSTIQWFSDGVNKKLNDVACCLGYNAVMEIGKTYLKTGKNLAGLILYPAFAFSMTNLLGRGARHVLEAQVPRLMGSTNELYLICSYIPYVAAGASLLQAVIMRYTISNQVKWHKYEGKLDQVIFDKIYSCAQYYRAMKAVYDLYSAEPAFAERHEHWEAFKNFFEREDLQSLFSAFESSTFDVNDNCLHNFGMIYLAWSKLDTKDVKEAFQKAFPFMGEVDTYLSIQKLFNDPMYKEHGLQFCLPEFSGEEQPVLEIEDAWHPLNDPATNVTNSAQLGASHRVKNVIITATNGEGKTSMLRTLILAVQVFQALGFAPGKSARLSNFNRIITSMHSVADSQKDRTSRFKAEMTLADSFVKEIKNHPHENVLVGLDEFATGSDYLANQASARGTIALLGSFEKTMVLAATHFPLVTTLERGGNFVNYTIAVDPATNKRTYKWVPGISQNKQDSQIIDEMQDFDPDLKQSIKDSRALLIEEKE